MLRPFDIVRVRPEYFEKNPKGTPLFMFGVYTEGERKEKEERLERLNRNDRENIGIVTETDGYSAAIEWFLKETTLHTAWWDERDLEVVNNLAVIMADQMAHPFGGNTHQGDKFYGDKKEEENG